MSIHIMIPQYKENTQYISFSHVLKLPIKLFLFIRWETQIKFFGMFLSFIEFGKDYKMS